MFALKSDRPLESCVGVRALGLFDVLQNLTFTRALELRVHVSGVAGPRAPHSWAHAHLVPACFVWQSAWGIAGTQYY